MAEYSTKLSFIAQLPPEAIDYAIRLARAVETAADSAGPSDPDPEIARIASSIHDDNGSHGCHFTRNHDGASLWVYSDDSATVEAVARIVHQTLRFYKLDGTVAFEWSNDCSKHRLDAYGGGAVVISRKTFRWMNTATWVEKATRPRPPRREAA